jgi:excisionase family DNA binding protein
LYTLREVAQAMRVHERTVYRLVRDGKLGAIRVGSQWRVPEQAFAEFVEQGLREPGGVRKRAKPGDRQLLLPFGGGAGE